MRKPNAQTKSRIIAAAWKLFYEKGYDYTTVEDIVELSATSKGSFYHYFEGKDALLGTLSTLFDEKYEELMPKALEIPDSFERLMFLNHELFLMIENSVSIELLSKLLSTQLFARGERHLLDRDRIYFKLLIRTVRAGQEVGELVSDVSANEIVKAYALCERAFMYDWCLCSGEYSLTAYSTPMLRAFLSHYRVTE
ncbi:MAG: TetR/AcrR family transcriptional regulator [Clostridia bacterium]|nr:TetR/AcrR family transcriptional regulator [Clostridia bacterium]